MMKRLLFGLLFFTFSTIFGQQKVKSIGFTESIERGAIIYEDFCMNCHMTDGTGVANINPPLALSVTLIENRDKSIKAVKFGQSGESKINGKTYNGVMAPMGLSDKEAADVMNYITTNFGNLNDRMFTEAEVLKIEK